MPAPEPLARQAALDPKAKGKTVVAATVQDDAGQLQTVVLCTLVPGRVDQCVLNLVFAEEVSFTLLEGGRA